MPTAVLTPAEGRGYVTVPTWCAGCQGPCCRRGPQTAGDLPLHTHTQTQMHIHFRHCQSTRRGRAKEQLKIILLPDP